MNKFNRGLEKFWLYFSIVVAVFCIYEFCTDDVDTAKWYLVFLALPILMYLFRRFIRIRMEKNSQAQKVEKKSKNKN